MNPKISIIVPIYNSEKYLSECLESLINQTMKEIEIICVINGCTDNSLSIVQEYMNKDERIRLIVNDEADIGAARNTGVRAAEGEYLMFVDSDDWIRLEACERLYATAIEHDLEIVQGRYHDVPKTLFPYFKCRKSEYCIKQSGMEFWRKNKNISPVNWDKIWKREFFISNELFNIEGIFFEDVLTTIKGMMLAKSFMIIDYQFYYHQCVIESIMNSRTTSKHITSSRIMINQLDSYLSENKLLAEPCIMLFYLKMVFVHHADYNKTNTIPLQLLLSKIGNKLMLFFPLKVKLTYFFPKTALRFYPVWRKRKLFYHIIKGRIRRINRRTGGRVFCRRKF